MVEFVVVVTLPGTPEQFARNCSGTVLVGRGEDCALRLVHPLVSRRHAELEMTADHSFLVRDLGSRNGTEVDGETIRQSEAVLRSGVPIKVGPYLLKLAPSGDVLAETVTVQGNRTPGRVVLDRGLHRVSVDSEVTIERLADLEFRLFDVLDRHRPNAVTNQSLGDSIWGSGQWDSYMLYNLVRRVRRKFDERGLSGESLVRTIANVGYHIE